MAWYGVNYVLGTGLHSYGFGSGYGYVAAFVAFEVAVIAAALVRQRRLAGRRAPVPARSPAAHPAL